MSIEIWRDTYDPRYEVSSAGNVRRKGGAVLRLRVHTNGYLRVSIGAKQDAYAHRLVCQAFHGDAPAPEYHADHINGDRADNRACNLRWLSPQQNRALRTFRRGATHSNSKLTEDAVREIKLSKQTHTTLATRFGVARRTITDVRSGKTWGHVNVE